MKTLQYPYAVETENVEKIYYLSKQRGENEHSELIVHALKGCTFKIKDGEFVSLLGPSGSGKTTLLEIIGGIVRPTRGNVFFYGFDLTAIKAKELALIRLKAIGYIFQDFRLIPVLSAFENIELPMVFSGIPREVRHKKARELLKMVGLENFGEHKPPQLSGGQQQRVAIARALANDPMLLLADEPTGNLDLVTAMKIIKLLRTIAKDLEITVLLSTHDLKIIGVSDRIIRIRDGVII